MSSGALCVLEISLTAEIRLQSRRNLQSTVGAQLVSIVVGMKLQALFFSIVPAPGCAVLRGRCEELK